MNDIIICPFCEGRGNERQLNVRDHLVSDEDFFIVKCNSCDFVFTSPWPDAKDFSRYYLSQEYISHTDASVSFTDKLYQAVRKVMLKKKFNFAVKHLTEPSSLRLLDYGCGTGEFLLYAKNRGVNVYGVEPNDAARNRAEKKQLNVQHQIPAITNEEDAFHLITLWHVLEHIPDVKDKLQLFYDSLKKDGLIIVAVPEYKSYDALRYKEYWAAWDVPRHVYHFEEKTIKMLFESKKFKYIKKYPLVFDAFYIALLSEKIKGNQTFALINAFLVGLISNLHATLGNFPWSSQVYVFKKIE